MKISLIGFMGAGKTSTATQLATRLAYPVIEMDETVLQKTGFSDMQELFNNGGELLLRKSEISLARELGEQDNIVISTGGGIVMNKITIDYLRLHGGIIIYLRASFEEISKRISSDPSPRPLFEDSEQAHQLYMLRAPLYEAYADKKVECDGRVIADITQEIVSYIHAHEQNHSPDTAMSHSR